MNQVIWPCILLDTKAAWPENMWKRSVLSELAPKGIRHTWLSLKDPCECQGLEDYGGKRGIAEKTGHERSSV